LPQAALAFRRQQSPPWITARHLGALNITAWLYRDQQGFEKILVNPNTTIAELVAQFGRAQTPDAEVGIHSEGRAAEWFRTQRGVQVLAIFTERIPCAQMCAPLLKHYYPNVPVYYYYDRRSWRGPGAMSAGEVLRSSYGL
jgi:hypothetical protein